MGSEYVDGVARAIDEKMFHVMSHDVIGTIESTHDAFGEIAAGGIPLLERAGSDVVEVKILEEATYRNNLEKFLGDHAVGIALPLLISFLFVGMCSVFVFGANLGSADLDFDMTWVWWFMSSTLAASIGVIWTSGRSEVKQERAVRGDDVTLQLYSTWNLILGLRSHPKAAGQYGKLNRMSEYYMKLIWLASKAEEYRSSLDNDIRIGGMIDVDVSDLEAKRDDIQVVLAAMSTYDQGISERVSMLGELLSYEGNALEITAESIGRATGYLMDQIDVVLESIETK